MPVTTDLNFLPTISNPNMRYYSTCYYFYCTTGRAASIIIITLQKNITVFETEQIPLLKNKIWFVVPAETLVIVATAESAPFMKRTSQPKKILQRVAPVAG